VVISAEHSYFLWAQNRSNSAFTDTLQLYAASPQCQAVARAVEEIDVTKSSLEGGIDRWKTETLRVLVQIARDNRLDA
jgi:rhodanese-related sulfurtransferase